MMLELIYIAPTIIAFCLRLFWWIYLSDPKDSFLPDTNDKCNEFIFAMLAFWPVVVFVVIAVAICVIVVWPFYFAAKKLRVRRINSEASNVRQNGERLATTFQGNTTRG